MCGRGQQCQTVRLMSGVRKIYQTRAKGRSRMADERVTMPELLSPAVVRDALSRLSGWSGGPEGIECTLRLSPGEYGDFTERLKVCSDALGHRPVLRRAGDTVEVWLRTDAEGGVTASDITLAARIDRIVGIVQRDS